MLIGVYSIQLPPEYERSIDEIEPACSWEIVITLAQRSVEPHPTYHDSSLRMVLSFRATRSLQSTCWECAWCLPEFSRYQDTYGNIQE